jgi:hypothetical protein
MCITLREGVGNTNHGRATRTRIRFGPTTSMEVAAKDVSEAVREQSICNNRACTSAQNGQMQCLQLGAALTAMRRN